MLDSGGGGGGRDLTPGDFHMMEGTVDVKTDSLYNFSQSYLKDVMAFEMNSSMPLAFMTMDAKADPGSGSIGRDEAFTEAAGLQLRMTLSSQDAETLTRDLVYGNMALVNVAMVMSEKYNGTDGWNASMTADAVNNAFSPPASGKSLADVRAEADRVRSLPVVDPYDVKFWNMSTKPDGSPYVAGEDYIIAGSAGAPIGAVTPGQDHTRDDPDTPENESNPYFVIPMEQTEEPDPYVPPAPHDENNPNAVRFNPDGSPAPTLQQEVDAAEDEPGVIDAYIKDGEVVRVYDPNMVV